MISRTIGGTTGQLRHFRNERLIGVAPIEDHFVANGSIAQCPGLPDPMSYHALPVDKSLPCYFALNPYELSTCQETGGEMGTSPEEKWRHYELATL